MSSAPDLISLLCLDGRSSQSPFGGQHRTILISKDFANMGDFVFNNLLQHFSRKEPQTPILLITLSHDWSSYSASAAKCGYNLRRTQNMGNIDVFDMMTEFLNASNGKSKRFNPCDSIVEAISTFIKKHTSDHQSDSSGARVVKPLIIMIDDISILSTIGCKENDIYKLFSLVNKSLRDRSKEIQSGKLSHFIVQTMATHIKSKQSHDQQIKDSLNYLVSNIENLCDLSITLKPLDTGYSTRVDGTIKIVDNRLPFSNAPQSSGSLGQLQIPSPFFSCTQGEIGIQKAYFFKLGDRRVRLTSSALIF